jgi:hypothetical protein
MKRKHANESSGSEQSSESDSPSEYEEPSDQSSSSSSDEEARIIQSAERFIGYFRGYLGANVVRVDAAYDSGSGWEQWLHVELFTYIRQQDTHADITREPNAYPGRDAGLRADFLFEGTTVEIKAETERQTAQQFANGVGRDAAKVERLDEGTALVVGVCLTGQSRDELQRVVDLMGQVSAGGQTIHYGYTASTV